MEFIKDYLTEGFWKTHKLVAIDECKMLSSNHKTLTIGKKYNVNLKLSNYATLAIRDDDKETHYFRWRDLDKYFNIRSKIKSNILSVNDLIARLSTFRGDLPVRILDLSNDSGEMGVYEIKSAELEYLEKFDSDEKIEAVVINFEQFPE